MEKIDDPMDWQPAIIIKDYKLGTTPIKIENIRSYHLDTENKTVKKRKR